MSTFKNKNSLRTIEAQIVQKLKNNEARPKFTGSYKKKACRRCSTDEHQPIKSISISKIKVLNFSSASSMFLACS